MYVVWSPRLGAEEKHVASATALIPGARVTHYWDGAMAVGTAYQPLLALRQPAWDVWLLFDRDAVWRGDTPPRPAWWEHQLHDAPPELHLDAARFASHALALHGASATPR